MDRRNIDDLINDLHVGISRTKKIIGKEKAAALFLEISKTEEKQHTQHTLQEKESKALYELRQELPDSLPHQINFDFMQIKTHPTILEIPEQDNSEHDKMNESIKEIEQEKKSQNTLERKKLDDVEDKEIMNKSGNEKAETEQPEHKVGKTENFQQQKPITEQKIELPELKKTEEKTAKITGLDSEVQDQVHADQNEAKTTVEFVKPEDAHEEHKLLQGIHEDIKLLAYEDPEKIKKQELESKKSREKNESEEKTKKTFKSEIKKILMIMPRDEMHSVLATPSIKILRKQFPESEIHALINEQSKGVLDNNPHLDRIITCNEGQAEQGIMNPLGLYNDKDFVNLLKNENYDAAISCENDRKSIVLTNSIRAKNRIAPKVFGLNFFVNNNVEINEDAHKIEQYLSLVSPLMNYRDGDNRNYNDGEGDNRNDDNIKANGMAIEDLKLRSSPLSTEERKVEFFLTDKEINQARKLLESYERPIVCVSCSASTTNRQWSQEKWAELLSNMVKFHGAKIIFVGHDSDKEFVKHVIEKMKYKKDVRNLVDKNLRISSALIAESDLFIGTNSEYLHIARALKTPLIGLFGPDNNKLYGYHEQTYRTIRKHTVCEY